MNAITIEEWQRAIGGLGDRLARLRAGVETLGERDRRVVGERADLGGITSAILRSDALELEGRPSQRLQAKRLDVGDVVCQAFGPSVGVTRCASEAADVRELWDRLLRFESQTDGILHGNPSSVLDLPDASVSIRGGRSLHVELQTTGTRAAPAGEVIAVPRFTHVMPASKLRNFGHWLLDCVPQVAVLAAVAPDATMLLPPGLKTFHRWPLGKLGLGPSQIVEWDGAPRAGGRVLVFESDGRSGGGRPLSALNELRRRIGPDTVAPDPGRPQRIYVSRRDARSRRQWVHNEEAIEELFRGRGFEIVSMAQCPLDEQVHVFRNARVVAGVSGAGLSGLLFSPPRTTAIVLVSDSLIRWYAATGARTMWLRGVGHARHLAALGDSPRFYAHLAAAFGQVCHSFVGSDSMPLDRLSTFIDEALASADQG